MKCPSCGAEVGNGKFCQFCGAQISVEMLREKEILNKVGCPKCGSTNVVFNRENQGEIHGKNVRKIVHYTVGVCKDCGHTWRTDNGQQANKRKTWLWVLGWIYCFPIPLTILLLRKKDMKPALKYGLIILSWLCVPVFMIIAGSGSDLNADTTTPSSEIVTEFNKTSETTTSTDEIVTESDKNTEITASANESVAKVEQTYVLTGEELGEYGRKIILNANTDTPVPKYLYKIPAGKYVVSTTNKKLASFFVVKDDTTTEDNPNYPEILDYVSGGYLLTAGDDDFNGNAQKNVTVTLGEDESFQLVGKDTFIFEKIADE